MALALPSLTAFSGHGGRDGEEQSGIGATYLTLGLTLGLGSSLSSASAASDFTPQFGGTGGTDTDIRSIPTTSSRPLRAAFNNSIASPFFFRMYSAIIADASLSSDLSAAYTLIRSALPNTTLGFDVSVLSTFQRSTVPLTIAGMIHPRI
jgi:hypothetical protein